MNGPRAPLPSEEELHKAMQRLRQLTRIQKWVARERRWRPGALAALGVGWGNPGLPCLGDRFVLPVRDENGALINVLGYHPKSSMKMVSLRGRPRDLWPAPERWASHRSILLVEGEPDAIAVLSGLPLETPVALPGARWSPVWAQRFTRFPHVTVLTDADAAGLAVGQRAADDLRAAGVAVVQRDWQDVVGAPVRCGYDATDFVLANPDAFRLPSWQ